MTAVRSGAIWLHLSALKMAPPQSIDAPLRLTRLLLAQADVAGMLRDVCFQGKADAPDKARRRERAAASPRTTQTRERERMVLPLVSGRTFSKPE